MIIKSLILSTILLGQLAMADIYRLTASDPDLPQDVPGGWQMIVAADPNNLVAITLDAKGISDQSQCWWMVLSWPDNATYQCDDDNGTRVDIYTDSADWLMGNPLSADYSSYSWATYKLKVEPYSLNAVVGAWARPVMSARLRPMAIKK